MTEQQLLFEKYFTHKDLKEGKKNCPCCGKKVAAYGYNLSRELVELAGRIYEYCDKRKSGHFDPKDIFGEEHKALTQFQKLKCHNILKREKGNWYMSRLGKQFLEGKIKLPKKVWVFDDRVVLTEDQYIWVWQVCEDWKRCSADWTADYILQSYNTKL